MDNRHVLDVTQWQRQELGALSDKVLELIQDFENRTDLGVLEIHLLPEHYGPRADKTLGLSIDVVL